MAKKKSIDWRVTLGGMVCLTAAELYALSQGINGIIFTVYVAVIAGAIGENMDKQNFLN